MALTANEWIRLLAGCFLAHGGSAAFAKSGGAGIEAARISPSRQMSSTLKIDERVSANASPPADTTGIVTEPSSDRSAPCNWSLGYPLLCQLKG